MASTFIEVENHGTPRGLAGRKPALHGRKRSHQHAFEHDVTEHGGEIGPARGLVQADRRHDRIVSALQVLAALRQRGVTLAEACADLVFYPQRLINVRVPSGFDWRADDGISDAQARAEQTLGDSGRVLLRPSGTEPLLRVMVEGRDGALVERLAREIAAVVEEAVG